MMHTRSHLLWLLFASALAVAQQEPLLIKRAPLLYPPIARAARVSGQVSLEFVLESNGETSAVSAVSGPAMLKGAAEEFVKSWRFDPNTVGANAGAKYTVTINYKAVEGVDDPRIANTTVHAESFRHFDLTVIVSDIQMSDCPTGSDTEVPQQEEDSDFVELARSGCYGTCPAYSVRLHADGTADWEGDGFVIVRGKRTARIDANASRALLEKFSTPAFWSYCGSYSRSITDESGAQITVELGGRKRVIYDYADSSPKELRELMLEVDRVTDSHRWRHGDPAQEPLSLIGSDRWLPKPGVTNLMLAACSERLGTLKAQIAEGANVSATDSSGWTALMYAASCYSSQPVQTLLSVGADPNQASPRGDTALMVDALSGNWNDDLVKAGASINAQNNAGQTALMFLATRGEPDEIADALKSGADPHIKDRQGRTALDYLRLASCGKSPVRDPIRAQMVGYFQCNAIDADDLKKSRALLVSSMHAQPHKAN